jgi:hypothetical protein
LRTLSNYVAKYGPEVGPRLYHVLQSQAAHAGVGARLRRKIESLNQRKARVLPLFAEVDAAISPADGPPSPPGGR